jgi:hypothetical protein
MMKQLLQLRFWSGLAMLLYVAATLFIAFPLFKLVEGNLPAESVFSLVLIILATLSLGLIVMIVLFIQWQKRGQKAEVIYVDRYIDAKKNNAQAVQSQEEERDERFLQQTQEMLAQIETQTEKYQLALGRICSYLQASAGALFLARREQGRRFIEMVASYAYHLPDSQTLTYEYGEGLAGQAAKEGKVWQINDVPQGYIQVVSGLGASTPSQLLLVPFKNRQNALKGVVEIAAFNAFSPSQLSLVQSVCAMLVEADEA